jgi:hypothetical protein
VFGATGKFLVTVMPTRVFSPSFVLIKTVIFKASSEFPVTVMPTRVFSPSLVFVQTVVFRPSSEFAATKLPTNVFTKSCTFTNSVVIANSNGLAQSRVIIASQVMTETLVDVGTKPENVTVAAARQVEGQDLTIPLLASVGVIVLMIIGFAIVVLVMKCKPSPVAYRNSDSASEIDERLGWSEDSSSESTALLVAEQI